MVTHEAPFGIFDMPLGKTPGISGVLNYFSVCIWLYHPKPLSNVKPISAVSEEYRAHLVLKYRVEVEVDQKKNIYPTPPSFQHIDSNSAGVLKVMYNVR